MVGPPDSDVGQCIRADFENFNVQDDFGSRAIVNGNKFLDHRQDFWRVSDDQEALLFIDKDVLRFAELTDKGFRLLGVGVGHIECPRIELFMLLQFLCRRRIDQERVGRHFAARQLPTKKDALDSLVD